MSVLHRHGERRLGRHFQRRPTDAALQVHMADHWQRTSVKNRLAFWQGEIARLRAELLQLLAGGRMRLIEPSKVG
jgi:uncharacterized small protein (DUF1192 family)